MLAYGLPLAEQYLKLEEPDIAVAFLESYGAARLLSNLPEDRRAVAFRPQAHPLLPASLKAGRIPAHLLPNPNGLVPPVVKTAAARHTVPTPPPQVLASCTARRQLELQKLSFRVAATPTGEKDPVRDLLAGAEQEFAWARGQLQHAEEAAQTEYLAAGGAAPASTQGYEPRSIDMARLSVGSTRDSRGSFVLPPRPRPGTGRSSVPSSLSSMGVGCRALATPSAVGAAARLSTPLGRPPVPRASSAGLSHSTRPHGPVSCRLASAWSVLRPTADMPNEGLTGDLPTAGLPSGGHPTVPTTPSSYATAHCSGGSLGGAGGLGGPCGDFRVRLLHRPVAQPTATYKVGAAGGTVGGLSAADLAAWCLMSGGLGGSSPTPAPTPSTASAVEALSLMPRGAALAEVCSAAALGSVTPSCSAAGGGAPCTSAHPAGPVLVDVSNTYRTCDPAPTLAGMAEWRSRMRALRKEADALVAALPPSARAGLGDAPKSGEGGVAWSDCVYRYLLYEAVAPPAVGDACALAGSAAVLSAANIWVARFEPPPGREPVVLTVRLFGEATPESVQALVGLAKVAAARKAEARFETGPARLVLTLDSGDPANGSTDREEAAAMAREAGRLPQATFGLVSYDARSFT